MRSIGVWTLSAYEATGNPTASGVMPYYGVVAFNHLPLGTRIYIAGYGDFIVADRCGIGSRCDIYLGDVNSCINFGIRSAEIFVYE
jgi:3D (Asp-Asp-Asp) domain-containing protein